VAVHGHDIHADHAANPENHMCGSTPLLFLHDVVVQMTIPAISEAVTQMTKSQPGALLAAKG
jgi:hypothetical protein